MTATDPINTPVIREGEREEIARIIEPGAFQAETVMNNRCYQNVSLETGRIHALAKADAILARHRQSEGVGECPSCHGLNTSCPDGCGRDPETGDLNGTRLANSAAPDVERALDELDGSDFSAVREHAKTLRNALTALSRPQTDGGTERAALDQNDAMRQELAHIGNLVSDLARAMHVDQANEDGSWTDLAGRIKKLTDAALATPQTDGEAQTQPALQLAREALEKIASCKSHHPGDVVSIAQQGGGA